MQASGRDSPRSEAPTPSIARNRPYYPLYLSSGEDKAIPSRGDDYLRLGNAKARSCARLLEMLYVPFGRSGSAEEAYLIYEERSEFEAARRFAPQLDCASAAHPSPVVGPEASFRSGVGRFLQIVEQHAVEDRALVDSAERLFATAARSSSLPNRVRWASAILAARVVADYRYDYPAARVYCDLAQGLAAEDSHERMTADWWRADAFVREGRGREANVVYRRILDRDAHRWPRSYIVARSQAILNKRGDR